LAQAEAFCSAADFARGRRRRSHRLLCQLAADATGRAVVAGPVEATAAGSVLMQALALGHLGSLAEARDVVRRSFEITTYEPRRDPAVEDAYARLLLLVGR
jgi:rhamnulokinase